MALFHDKYVIDTEDYDIDMMDLLKNVFNDWERYNDENLICHIASIKSDLTADVERPHFHFELTFIYHEADEDSPLYTGLLCVDCLTPSFQVDDTDDSIDPIEDGLEVICNEIVAKNYSCYPYPLEVAPPINVIEKVAKFVCDAVDNCIRCGYEPWLPDNDSDENIISLD